MRTLERALFVIGMVALLSIVGIVNRSRAWYESGAAVRRAAVRKA